MKRIIQYHQHLTRLVFLAVVPVVFAASGCAAGSQLANYDEQVEKSVIELQKNVDALLQKIETNAGSQAGSYDQLKPSYTKIQTEITALDVRVSSKPKNEKTIEQVKLLQQNLNSLEEIHKEGIQNNGIVAPLRSQFTSAFTAILTLERAKKRSE